MFVSELYFITFFTLSLFELELSPNNISDCNAGLLLTLLVLNSLLSNKKRKTKEQNIQIILITLIANNIHWISPSVKKKYNLLCSYR